MTRFQPDYSVTIRAGRAYVRLIEAASALVEWEEDERSQAKRQYLAWLEFDGRLAVEDGEKVFYACCKVPGKLGAKSLAINGFRYDSSDPKC